MKQKENLVVSHLDTVESGHGEIHVKYHLYKVVYHPLGKGYQGICVGEGFGLYTVFGLTGDVEDEVSKLKESRDLDDADGLKWYHADGGCAEVEDFKGVEAFLSSLHVDVVSVH